MKPGTIVRTLLGELRVGVVEGTKQAHRDPFGRQVSRAALLVRWDDNPREATEVDPSVVTVENVPVIDALVLAGAPEIDGCDQAHNERSGGTDNLLFAVELEPTRREQESRHPTEAPTVRATMSESLCAQVREPAPLKELRQSSPAQISAEAGSEVERRFEPTDVKEAAMVGAQDPIRSAGPCPSWSLLDRTDLIKWREARDLSHRDVALLLGISRRTCSYYESGQRTPSRELQARMVELIRGAAVEPRSHRHRPRRRHRWRHVKPADLREWRERNALTREQVGEILQVHAGTISGWERDEWAPPPWTQRRLAALIKTTPLSKPAPRVEAQEDPVVLPSLRARPGYDYRAEVPRGEIMSVSTEPNVDTADDLGIKRRIQSVMEGVHSGDIKLPNVHPEARWGVSQGVAAISSKETRGMYYFFDQATGSFFRTQGPQSNRIAADRPQGVISQDRTWLYRLLDQIPGGKNVIARYHTGTAQGASAVKHSAEEKPVTTAPVPSAADRLLDIQEVEARRVVLVETTKLIELGPHQVHALLRKAGATFPDTAEVKALEANAPGFMVEWSLVKDIKQERFFDSEATGVERKRVSPEQLAAMFTLVGKKIDKPAVTITPQGYVKIEWKESREEVVE